MSAEEWYEEFEIFDELDDYFEDLEESTQEGADETLVPKIIYRAELYLNQEELVKERVAKYNVTKEELDAIQNAASAVHHYRLNGTVDKTAMDFIEEVQPGDIKRQIQLLNIVIPLARTFKVTTKERKQSKYFNRDRTKRKG